MRILQILFCAFLVVLVADTAWSKDLSEEVKQEVAQKVVQALPQDVHVRSLAISEIEGDDGSLSRLLTQKIQEHSHYILVEREELEQIIDEQGFQVSDLVSPEQRVEPGQIKGVEGILFGEIVQKNGWPMQEEFKVHLRLGNVQTGEILMAQDFSASSAASYRNAVYAAVALGVLLLVMGFVFRSRARSRAQRREQANWDLRQDSTNELQLTQKIQEHSHYILVEREELEQIIDEQGFQ
ncbi:MAG: CsgG/HfaB family protein, partial [Marinobacter sp.]